MSIDEYTDALRRELRDQPREVRRSEVDGLREHLDELPAASRDSLGRPVEYAKAYRAERGLRVHKVRYWWRGIRLWARIVMAVVLVLAVGAVWGGVWLARYQPVTVEFNEGGPVRLALNHPCKEQNGVPDLICTVRTGDERFVGGYIRNHSRFTVDLLPPVNPAYGMLEVVRFLGVPCDRQSHVPQDCPPVKHYPVHIPPGSSVYVSVVLRVVGTCIPAVDSDGGVDLIGFEPITMRFHFVGGTRVVTIPPDNSTALQFAGGCSGTRPAALSAPSQ